MIGALNKQLWLQEAVRLPDAGGGFTTSFENVSASPAVYASITPVSGAESLRAARVSARQVFRIIIRWRADVTTDMRLLGGEKTYAILSAVDVNGRQNYLEIIAELVA